LIPAGKVVRGERTSFAIPALGARRTPRPACGFRGRHRAPSTPAVLARVVEESAAAGVGTFVLRNTTGNIPLRKIAARRQRPSNLQPSIRKGNPRAIEVGVKLLGHTARIQGYASPQRHELTGEDGQPLTLLQILKVIGPIPDED
jgi:hypothetical protein